MHFNNRIDGFNGTDLEYIRYLESVVIYLRGHDSVPPVPSPPSSPDSPRAVIHANNSRAANASFNVDGSFTILSQPQAGDRDLPLAPERRQNGSTVSCLRELQCIPYLPCLEPTSRPSKRSRAPRPRWQESADELLQRLPTTQEWSTKRKEMSLDSENELLQAYDMILSIAQPAEIGHFRKPAHSPTIVDHSSRSNHPCDLARTYAQVTKHLEDRSKFTNQMLLFRQLVFVSFCVLLRHIGTPRDTVESIMQVCISNSNGKYLEELQLGARWVNRMIAHMIRKGFGNRASEVFALCEFLDQPQSHRVLFSILTKSLTVGLSIAKYGKLAHSVTESSRYFKEQLLPQIHIPLSYEPHDRLPFSIPFFLKIIVGDRCRYGIPPQMNAGSDFYSLRDICVALGYDEDQMTESEYVVVAQYHKDAQRHVSGEWESKLLLLRGS